jgi:hypothetical protein
MLCLVALALAQDPALTHRWEEGLRVESQQLTVLGGWAAANLVGGTAGLALAKTPEGRAFHGSNAAWNVVNLGIAGFGAVGLQQRQRAGIPDADTLAQQHRSLRTALAVNLVLDGVYVGAGGAMWAKGGEVRGVPLRSVGQSLLLQGAFLGVFDAVFLARHRARTSGG